MTQTQFNLTSAGRSQNEKLRDHLKANPGRWVPMPELARVITPTGIGAAVHSRVADCRKKFGMEIEQRSERRQGANCSEYRYEPQESVRNMGAEI